MASSNTKRKSSNQTSRPQPGIQNHFNNSERKSTGHSSSPESKRRKLEREQARSATFNGLSSDNMYNFGGTKAKPIDAASPNGASPKARRVSNLSSLSMQNGINGQTIGTRKLVVKNLRTNSSSKPVDYVGDTLKQLDAALLAILNDEQPARSNEELYKGAENVCKLGSAADLHKLVDRRCKEHISGNVRPVLASKADDKNVDVLRAVVRAWDVWDKQAVSICFSSRCFAVR